MPDHLHLIVRGLDEQNQFKSFMKVMRQRSTLAFKRVFGEELWQDGYFDRILRDADDEREKIGYIAGNAIRAGLCAQPEEYRYAWWPGHSIDLSALLP